MERERKILQYLDALDSGDLETVSAILREAERDPILSDMLLELHVTYDPQPTSTDLPAPRVYTNGHHTTERVIPPASSRSRGRHKGGYLLALSAAVAAILIVLAGLLLIPEGGETGDQASQPITTQNVMDLAPATTLGDGLIHYMAWTPDGEHLTLATSQGIYLHDADNLDAEPRTFGGQNAGMYAIAYSGDGERLAGVREGEIWVWDATTGEVLSQLNHNADETYDIYINQDGSRVATPGCGEFSDNNLICRQPTVHIWDVENEVEINSIPVEVNERLFFNPDWSLVGHLDDTTAAIYLSSMATGESVATITPDIGIGATVVPVFSEDGERIRLVNVVSGAVSEVLDLDNLLEQEETGPATTARSTYRDYAFAEFSEDGNRMVWISSDGNLNTTYLSDDPAQMTMTSINAGLYDFQQAILHPNGRRVAVLDHTGAVLLWDLEEGTLVSQFSEYGTYYQSVVFRGDQVFGSNGWNGPPRAWDTTADQPKTEVIRSADEFVRDYHTPTINPDGTLLAYLLTPPEFFTQVQVIEIETGEAVNIGNLNAKRMTFASDGTLLALGRPGYLERWHPETGLDGRESIKLSDMTLAEVRDFGRLVGFGPDGRLIAVMMCYGSTMMTSGIGNETNCRRSEINLWDAQTGDLLMVLDMNRQLQPISATMGNWSGGITIDPSTQTLVSSLCRRVVRDTADLTSTFSRCDEAEVAVWDISAAYDRLESPAIEPVETQYHLQDAVLITGYSSPPLNIAISPQSTREALLLAVPGEGEIRFWSVDVPAMQAEFLETIPMAAISIAFNDDGTLMGIGSTGTVQLWHVPR